MKVKSESEVTQSCPTLCDPMDWSLPGSSVHRIFQARVLEWGAIAFSTQVPKSEYKWPEYVHVCMLSCFSCVRLFVTLWTVALQAPLSMGFPRQGSGVGCHALLQGLFNTGIEPTSLMSHALAAGFFTTRTTWKAHKWPGPLHIFSCKQELTILLNTFLTDCSRHVKLCLTFPQMVIDYDGRNFYTLRFEEVILLTTLWWLF